MIMEECDSETTSKEDRQGIRHVELPEMALAHWQQPEASDRSTSLWELTDTGRFRPEHKPS